MDGAIGDASLIAVGRCCSLTRVTTRDLVLIWCSRGVGARGERWRWARFALEGECTIATPLLGDHVRWIAD